MSTTKIFVAGFSSPLTGWNEPKITLAGMYIDGISADVSFNTAMDRWFIAKRNRNYKINNKIVNNMRRQSDPNKIVICDNNIKIITPSEKMKEFKPLQALIGSNRFSVLNLKISSVWINSELYSHHNWDDYSKKQFKQLGAKTDDIVQSYNDLITDSSSEDRTPIENINNVNLGLFVKLNHNYPYTMQYSWHFYKKMLDDALTHLSAEYNQADREQLYVDMLLSKIGLLKREDTYHRGNYYWDNLTSAYFIYELLDGLTLDQKITYVNTNVIIGSIVTKVGAFTYIDGVPITDDISNTLTDHHIVDHLTNYKADLVLTFSPTLSTEHHVVDSNSIINLEFLSKQLNRDDDSYNSNLIGKSSYDTRTYYKGSFMMLSPDVEGKKQRLSHYIGDGTSNKICDTSVFNHYVKYPSYKKEVTAYVGSNPKYSIWSEFSFSPSYIIQGDGNDAPDETFYPRLGRRGIAREANGIKEIYYFEFNTNLELGADEMEIIAFAVSSAGLSNREHGGDLPSSSGYTGSAGQEIEFYPHKLLNETEDDEHDDDTGSRLLPFLPNIVTGEDLLDKKALTRRSLALWHTTLTVIHRDAFEQFLFEYAQVMESLGPVGRAIFSIGLAVITAGGSLTLQAFGKVVLSFALGELVRHLNDNDLDVDIDQEIEANKEFHYEPEEQAVKNKLIDSDLGFTSYTDIYNGLNPIMKGIKLDLEPTSKKSPINKQVELNNLYEKKFILDMSNIYYSHYNSFTNHNKGK